MAIDFPANPGAQSPINTFSPTSTPLANTTNSVTFLWDGTKWTAAGSGGGAAPLWQRDGGTSTLSPVTADDNINQGAGDITTTGDLSAAAGTFSNQVSLGTVSGTADEYVRLYPTGGVVSYAKNSADYDYTFIGRSDIGGSHKTTHAFRADGQLNIGGNIDATLSASPNITLSANGDITANGNISGANGIFEGDVQTTSLNGGPLAGMRNQLINSDFRIWQRGTSFPKDGTQFRYSADRWEGNGAFCDFSRDVGLGGITNSIRVHNVTAGFAYIVQHIELVDTDSTFCQFAPGSTWTLSYWIKDNTSGAPTIDFRADRNGTNELQWTALSAAQVIETSGTWTRYSRTFTAATYVKGQHDRATVYIPAINSNDTTFTGIQLEPGPVATVFEYRPIQTELALCQRYYQIGRAAWQCVGGNAFTWVSNLPNVLRTSSATVNTSSTSGRNIQQARLLQGFGRLPVTLQLTAGSGSADVQCATDFSIDAEL